VFDPKAWTETGAFRALKDAPLCVAGWAGGKRLAPGSRDVDYVAVGDVGGHVHFLKVIDTTDGEKAERPGVGRALREALEREGRAQARVGDVPVLRV
jgi:hypothetical protein